MGIGVAAVVGEGCSELVAMSICCRNSWPYYGLVCDNGPPMHCTYHRRLKQQNCMWSSPRALLGNEVPCVTR